MFANIIVAVDSSDHAMRAIATACAVAQTCDSALHLVHAPHFMPDSMVVGADAYLYYPTREEMAANGRSVMTQATEAAVAHGVTPTGTHIGHGPAAEVVVKLAEDLAADLIVVGRRGLGGFGSMVLGSTSLRIAQLAPCAVLTVK